MDQHPDHLTAEVILEDAHTAIVRLAGDIDVATSPLITDAIDDAVHRGATQIVLDLSTVTFMDSSGIAALIVIRSTVPVVLRSPSQTVVRLLATTGLTDTFTIES